MSSSPKWKPTNINVDKNLLPALANKAAEDIIDEGARMIAMNIWKQSQIFLNKEVYTRPNSQVTADKMTTVPEPTGALANSGYVKFFKNKDIPGVPNEAQAESAAKSSNPDIAFGEIPPGPGQFGHAQVLYGAEYALYVETGTKLGMIPRPYLKPAVDMVEPMVLTYLVNLLKQNGFS